MENEYLKYQHIERFDTAETRGIEMGMCYVFPKIDGTNSQLWFDEKLRAGSRKRELTLESDNAGFLEWANEQENIKDFFIEYPSLRLYGEWLVPHTLKTYQETAWNNFYVFDVMCNDEYLEYDAYSILLVKYNIEYIPPICKIENPTYKRLINQLDKNGYLIENGKGTGEGIVVKNYDYKNRYGRITWAKIVKNEFKEKHDKKEVTELKESKIIEQEIVKRYVTLVLIEKEYSKIDNEIGWTSKQIPRLLNTVFYCLIKEESWNFIKQFKNPIIDYRRLLNFTIIKIKELKPELF